MANNKDNKPLTLEDLAGLIKAETTFIREDLTGLIKGETARLEEKIEATESKLEAKIGATESNLEKRIEETNELINDLAAMTKSEFERLDGKISQMEPEIAETKKNTEFLKNEFRQVEIKLGSKVDIYAFERVIKQNGLKSDVELVQARGRLHK